MASWLPKISTTTYARRMGKPERCSPPLIWPPMAEDLPAVGYPDVPRPPIGFSIDVPDHWTLLDLDPTSGETWVSAFLSARLAGRTQASAERGPARRALLSLLQQLRGEQVFMALILAAEAGGELYSASATLAWRQLEPFGVAIPVEGLAKVYRQAPAGTRKDLDDRQVEIVTLPAGPAVRVSSTRTVELAGIEAPPVAQTQHVVPVLQSSWLALLTTSTANPSLVPAVDDIADEMADSLTFTPVPPGP